MAALQHDVMSVLIDMLLDKELISKTVHDKAIHLVNSRIDFPAFFQYPLRYQEEVKNSGFTSNPTGTSAR